MPSPVSEPADAPASTPAPTDERPDDGETVATDRGSSAAAAPRTRRQRLQTLAIGFGAGLLNGLLGIGGGILIVPGMILLRGLQPRVAVSTSLGTVLVLSLLALSAHLALSGLAFSLQGTALVLLCGALGAQGGGFLLRRIPQRWILFVFAGLTLFSATNLIGGALFDRGGPLLQAGPPPLWGFVVTGLIAGFFSGMLGIGGGALVVLGLAVLFHTPILGGLPLALMVNVANAGSGVFAQRGTGHVLWGEVVRLVPAALVGIAAGVGAAVLLPSNALRIVFALFFLFMGFRLVRRGLRTAR